MINPLDPALILGQGLCFKKRRCVDLIITSAIIAVAVAYAAILSDSGVKVVVKGGYEALVEVTHLHPEVSSWGCYQTIRGKHLHGYCSGFV